MNELIKLITALYCLNPIYDLIINIKDIKHFGTFFTLSCTFVTIVIAVYQFVYLNTLQPLLEKTPMK